MAFNNVKESKDILLNCWEELKENDKCLSSIIDFIYNELSDFFFKVHPKFIIMSQYKSAYYMKQKKTLMQMSM